MAVHFCSLHYEITSAGIPSIAYSGQAVPIAHFPLSTDYTAELAELILRSVPH